MRFSNILAVISVLGYVQAMPTGDRSDMQLLNRDTKEPPSKLPTPVKTPPSTGNAATDKTNAEHAAAAEAAKDAGLLFDAERANNEDAKKHPKNAGADAKANKDQEAFHAADATADEQSIAKGISSDLTAEQKGKGKTGKS